MSSTSTKIALVTGGAKRVGAAIVRALADDGWRVCFTFLSSRNEAEVLAVSVGGVAIHADLTNPDIAIPSIVKSVGQKLDLLVNNASIYPKAPFEALHVATIQKLLAIHVESPLRLAQVFAPALRSARGQIINMVDAQLDRPMKGYAAYNASKAGLANLTLSLARELAPNVTVNGIAPGVVEWPDDFPQAERDAYLRRVPLQRAGTPADVANLVRFLASDSAGYITGQIIRLDGGRSIVG